MENIDLHAVNSVVVKTEFKKTVSKFWNNIRNKQSPYSHDICSIDGLRLLWGLAIRCDPATIGGTKLELFRDVSVEISAAT